MFLKGFVKISSNVLLQGKTGSSFRYSSGTVQGLMDHWKKKFEEEKVTEALPSIEIILAHVLNKKNLKDLRECAATTKLTDEEHQTVHEFFELRLIRMPVQYIIGQWDFRDLRLKMVPPVFIPRPETEELVELILQQVDITKKMKILEIGCGSGAISLSLLKSLPAVECIAIDQSKLACRLTMDNAQSLNLSQRLKIFKHKINSNTLPDEIGSNFDLIVSNPPYVPTREMRQLEPEIKIYEDLRALDGGKDGLKFIEILLEVASTHLLPNGHLWIEIHSSHPKLIQDYLEKNLHLGLKFSSSYNDIFGHQRFVEIIKV